MLDKLLLLTQNHREDTRIVTCKNENVFFNYLYPFLLIGAQPGQAVKL